MQRLLVGVAVAVMAISVALLFYARGRVRAPATAEDFAHLPKKSTLPALFPSPDFAFRAHTGETVTRRSLEGKPYVANFVFTTCRTVCPLLTAKMVRLQRELNDVPMHFVSFSVDPEHDTVDALAAYAKGWNPDEPRWLLLETTPPGLQQVADGFHVTAQRTDGGLDRVMHSAVFVLVDERGVVRGVFDSEEQDDFRALAAAARALAGSAPPPPRAEVRSGEVLFHELSCSNCHEHPELAPALGGLLGQRRELESRLLVTADEAYVRESIVAPDAKRVNGYPLKMPSYAGHLTDAELKNLVAYVTSLPAPVAAAPDVALAVDPVCHMKVRVTPDALKLERDGGATEYFCSAWCRKRFEENPDAYRH
ncbi:MAG: SCO family protein [Myxococcota bacterium]